MNTGVRQGCLLSPLLFLVALDWVPRQAFGDNKTGIQFTLLQKLEDLDFAHDMVLLSQKITHMRQTFATLLEQAARVGLNINASKTKEMRIRSPANTGNINCDGEVLVQVSAFTYLGGLITMPPLAALRKMLRPGAGTGCILHFKTHMEIKVHLTVDKDKNL